MPRDVDPEPLGVVAEHSLRAVEKGRRELGVGAHEHGEILRE